LHFLVLAARNDVEIPTVVGERVQALVDFLLAVRRPDGSTPHIGDSDGGRILPLVRRQPDDVRDLFSTAAAFFGRADYAWAAGEPALETRWLLGGAGAAAFDALAPAPPDAGCSRAFPAGGYVIMASGWHASAHALTFDVGPFGCPGSAGHGHADLLSVQCSVFGSPYLVDPGTYTYTGDPGWRSAFRSTAAHSTVLIDGVGQSLPAGPFSWTTKPRATLRRWVSTAEYDFADADHSGYRALPDPVVHRRRVAFIKPRYWLIVDDLEGAEEHTIDVRFQCAPIAADFGERPWLTLRGPDGHALRIGVFGDSPVETRIVEGQIAPIEGWVSPDYGQRQPAPMAVFATKARLPLRLATLLIPEKTHNERARGVSYIRRDAATCELSFAATGERITVTDSAIVCADAVL
jgi:hypothetical protein